MSNTKNRRILVVDDQKSIHDDFRMTLSADDNELVPLRDITASLFGEAPAPATIAYSIDSAFQGEEAVQCVENALNEGRPYALAFVDIRMPPGIDGIETIERIWRIDDHIQIVICTAFTDYSWNEIQRRLRDPERYLILRKPFEVVEVRQLASFLTMKWQHTQTPDAIDQFASEG